MSSSFKKYGIRIAMAINLASAIFVFNSCVEELEFPEGFYEELLVVNSIIDPDTIPLINLSKSMTPSGLIEFEYISDAVIEMGQEETVGSMNFNYTELGWYSNNDISIQSGNEYYIEVNASNYPSIQSQTIVPDKPTISEIVFKGDSISFEIIDNPSIDQYYFVTLKGWVEDYKQKLNEDGTYSSYSDTVFRRLWTVSEEEYIEAWYDGRYGWVNNLTGFTFDDEFWDVEPQFEAESFVFSDQLFNGKSICFNMEVNLRSVISLENKPEMELRVYCIDEHYYKYLVSMAQYLTTDEAPLTNRAKVYNNITNGYGVFGSQNGIKREIVSTYPSY